MTKLEAPAMRDQASHPIEGGYLHALAASPAAITPTSAPVQKPIIKTVEPLDIADACTSRPPALDFVLPGILAGSVCGDVSPGGIGKSMLALQKSLLVAGVDTLGGAFGTPTVGKTTILALEDPPIILQHRIFNIFRAATGADQPGWSPKNKISPTTWAENCRIIPLLGTGFKVDDASGHDRVCRYSDGQRLVIVDTLRRCHSQEENDNGSMAEVLGIFEKAAKATGATFLLLHHVPKPSGTGGPAVTARGASAITDNMRYLAIMRSLTQDELEKLVIDPSERWMHVIYEPIKNNYCPPSGPLWFCKGPGGVLEYQGKLNESLDIAATTPRKRKKGKYD